MSTGTAVAEQLVVTGDLLALADCLDRGDWMAAGLHGATAALDAGSLATDPLQTLVSAGATWLMETLDPLKGWLDDLAGQPVQVQVAADGFRRAGQQVSSLGEEVMSAVVCRFGAMEGHTVEAAREFCRGEVDRLAAVSRCLEAVASSLGMASACVQTVREVVREAVAEVVAAVLVAAAQCAVTLGVGTPLLVHKAVTTTNRLVTRVGPLVLDLVDSVARLSRLLDDLLDQLYLLRQAAGPLRARGPRSDGLTDELTSAAGILRTRLHSLSPGEILQGGAIDAATAMKDREAEDS